MQKKCRVCGGELFKKPLIGFKNMPSRAQFLPDAESIKKDKGVDFEVCQCTGCGLVQLNSEPVYYYKEVVRAAAVSEEMKKFRQEQFSSFVQKFSLQGKKIIEIGSGRGEYLSLMRNLGAMAFGLEYSKKSVAFCKKNGLRVIRGFIRNEKARIEQAPFDAFYMLSFLEHLPKPNATLRGICNNLIEGAVGIIEVPNFDMILKDMLFAEFSTEHLVYFTKETFKTMLSINGFEVLQLKEVWHDYILSAVVRKKPKLDLSQFKRSQKKIEKEIHDYLKRFGQKKVAAWGAGHQAMALISLLNLGKKLKYVIDSAPQKQGRFTLASHVPIISPADAKKDPPDAIIVIAGSYSGEVAKIIKQEYGKEIKIIK